MAEAIEAVKVALRQSKDGVVVSFVLHPSDDLKAITTMPIGQRVMLAVEAITDTPVAQLEEHPNSSRVVAGSSPAGGAKPKTRLRDKPLSNQAGILCSNYAFQAWSGLAQAGTPDEMRDATEVWLKEQVDIRSFKQLNSPVYTAERERFITLVERFEIESGRVAAPTEAR